MYNLHFKGTSWERSGIWFSANTQQGLEEVKCRDTESAGYAGYTSTQLDYIPYPCSKRTGTLNTLNWNQVFSGTASSEITGFDLTSQMADKRNADDKASLYQMIFWVR